MDVILEKFDERIQRLSEKLDTLDPITNAEEYSKLQKIIETEISSRNAYKKREDESENLELNRRLEQDKIDDQRRIDEARLEQTKKDAKINRLVYIGCKIGNTATWILTRVFEAKGGLMSLHEFKTIDHDDKYPF